MKSDIKDKKDLELLVRTFYADVLKDPLLHSFFSGLSFEHHIPKMVHFWAFVCFDQPGYTTNVTQVHAQMPLNKNLFNQWVNLFHSTVDQLFEGPLANKVKERASVMGITMASKHTHP